MVIETLVAKTVVPNIDPVTDGIALGAALVDLIRKGADVDVSIDGLRAGAVNSSFFNAALHTLTEELGAAAADHVRWRAQSPVLRQIAIKCASRWGTRRQPTE